MEKLLNHRLYIVIAAIVILIACIFIVRTCTHQREVYARVSPLNVEQGIPVAFADSTKGADRWLWEFGNGDTASTQRGQYIFAETGRYQMRLTVNDKYMKKFIVEVRSPKDSNDLEIIKIIAPDNALQGEYITFRGEGTSNDWRWEFGESGTVDAKEKAAIYKYSLPGTYEVLLTTEETKYPIRHFIEITPQYTDNDSTDVASIIGNDIKEKLQSIVDQKPFNKNYNYILETYLCKNPNTPVVINNNKKNDFYSYCQGLKIQGRDRTVIEKVLIDIQESDACIKKIIVIQTDID